MKRMTFVALALTLTAVGCDEVLTPVAPTAGTVTLVGQLSAAQEVPPATAPESAATGSVQVTMVPTSGGAYVASFTFAVGGLVKAGVLPAPLDSGSVIVASHIHSGAAGVAGPVLVPLPISSAAPIVTPTGSVLLTVGGVTVPADIAAGILANPAGYYFNMHSALNPAGVVRGQLIRQ